MEEIGGELEAHRSLYDGGVYDEEVWQGVADQYLTQKNLISDRLIFFSVAGQL